MKILIAPDKFKGSLGAHEVAAAIAAGVASEWPEAELIQLPVADGGEGTARIIASALGGEIRTCKVHDALGREVEAEYGWIPGARPVAVIETSQANGLWRLGTGELDPLRASTFGVGELIAHAVQDGAARIIAGIGGSATNDAGTGCAAALGWKFLNGSNDIVEPIPQNLRRIVRLDSRQILRLPKIEVACDVTNPLLGPSGATTVYGRQKGVDAETAPVLESALAHIANLAESATHRSVRQRAGAGAAGGLGFGLMVFAGAELRPGFPLIADLIGLPAKVAAADIIITGEGCVDAQTGSGKAPAGVRDLALQAGRPVVCMAGRVEDGTGFTEAWDIRSLAHDQAEAMTDAARLLRQRAALWAKSWVSGKVA